MQCLPCIPTPPRFITRRYPRDRGNWAAAREEVVVVAVDSSWCIFRMMGMSMVLLMRRPCRCIMLWRCLQDPPSFCYRYFKTKNTHGWLHHAKWLTWEIMFLTCRFKCILGSVGRWHYCNSLFFITNDLKIAAFHLKYAMLKHLKCNVIFWARLWDMKVWKYYYFLMTFQQAGLSNAALRIVLVAQEVSLVSSFEVLTGHRHKSIYF